MDNKIYSKVFTWLFVGLLITYVVGYGLSIIMQNNIEITKFFFSGYTYIIFIIAELAIAILLGTRIRKVNSTLSKILYIVYCCLTGITFSAIFMVFKVSSVMTIFLITSIIFGIFAVIGSRLNVDLSKFGTFLLMAIIGIVIVEIINIFVGNAMIDMILSAVAILIFTLYIGYDIKVVQEIANENVENDNLAICCAFQLYLDFINIFIRLIYLFGESKD